MERGGREDGVMTGGDNKGGSMEGTGGSDEEGGAARRGARVPCADVEPVHSTQDADVETDFAVEMIGETLDG